MFRLSMILTVILISIMSSLFLKIVDIREDVSNFIHDIVVASSGLRLAEVSLISKVKSIESDDAYDDSYLPKSHAYQYPTSYGFSKKEIKALNKVYKELNADLISSKSYGFITERGNYLSLDEYSDYEPIDNIDFCDYFSICPSLVDSSLGFGLSDVFESSTRSFDRTMMLYTRYLYFDDDTGISISKKIRLDNDYLPVGSKTRIYLDDSGLIRVEVVYEGFPSLTIEGYVKSGDGDISYTYSIPIYYYFNLYDLVFYSTFLAIVLLLFLQTNKSQKLSVKYSETLNMAIYDELTGLENANSLNQFKSQTHVKPYTVVFIDGNGIKQINDQFGHRAGNESIVAIADALRTSVRGSDRVFRYGGDEFVLYLDCTDQKVVSEVIERIHRNVLILGKSSVSVSVGVSRSNESNSFEELLKLADMRMYEHKAAMPSSSYV